MIWGRVICRWRQLKFTFLGSMEGLTSKHEHTGTFLYLYFLIRDAVFWKWPLFTNHRPLYYQQTYLIGSSRSRSVGFTWTTAKISWWKSFRGYLTGTRNRFLQTSSFSLMSTNERAKQLHSTCSTHVLGLLSLSYRYPNNNSLVQMTCGQQTR